MLFSQGDKAEKIYIVVNGEFKVTRKYTISEVNA